jgi:hypothetical protein
VQRPVPGQNLPAGLGAADWASIRGQIGKVPSRGAATGAVVQQAYLKASNSGDVDLFGRSVAISGNTVVVGAPGERSNAAGVDGNQGDDSALDAGAAYVFVRNGTTWSQQAYLKASNSQAGDGFGSSVAISGDTLVVGAYTEDSNATGVNGDQGDNSAFDSGAAYVFVRTGSTWSQQAYLKASNADAHDLFGSSMELAGNSLVVGAPGEDSNATGVDGNQGDNSALTAGAAYVFVLSGSTWSQQAYLKASNADSGDGFGLSVSASGDTVVAGALHEDSNATGINGNQGDNSGLDSGAAYVFVRSGSTWSQQAYLKAANAETLDNFGAAVAVSANTLVAGAIFEASSATGVNGNPGDNSAFHSGAAYVFVRSGTAWSQQAYLKASNTGTDDLFGFRVAVAGNVVVVAAPFEASNATGVDGDPSDNSALLAGAAYLFIRSGSTWIQRAYLKASNTDQEDEFGQGVAVSGDTIVVGAFGEGSNATGVNGDPSDNSFLAAGAAYVFGVPGPIAEVPALDALGLTLLALLLAAVGLRAVLRRRTEG